MKLPAYCSENFIHEVFKREPVDYFDEDSRKRGNAKLKWSTLILEHLTLLIDTTPDALGEKMKKDPVLAFILKNNTNRIAAVSSHFKELRTTPEAFFSNEAHFKELFCLFLGNIVGNLGANYEREFGYPFTTESTISSDKERIFINDVESLRAGSKVDWLKLADFIPCHHSLVLADPYLLKNLNNSQFIEFVNLLSEKAAKRKYHFTFIGGKENSDSLKQADKMKAIILKKIPQTIFSAYKCSAEEFHDRHLITNVNSITCGAGFDISNARGSIKKETRWDVRTPWSFLERNGRQVPYATAIVDNLESVKKWIRKGTVLISPSVINPLLK